MKPYEIVVDVKNLNTFQDNTVPAKQGDIGREVIATITDNGVPVNLTGRSVIFFVEKKDNQTIFNDTEITDAEQGQVKFKLTTQVLVVPKILEAELLINDANENKISSALFNINVKRSINDPGAVESTNEFTALDSAINSINIYRNEMNNLESNYSPKLQGLEEQFNDVVANVTIDSEVIAARVNADTGRAYDSLGFRLDNGESKINELENLAIEYIPRKWKDVQNLVRAGLHKKAFKIGDQFITTYNGLEYPVDVIGINHDTPTDTNFTNSLTLQFHDCLMNAQFSAPQALYTAKTSELLAGQYYFEHDGVAYQFTLTQNLAIGGQLTFPWAYNTDILTTKVSSFENNISTTAIETVEITEGAAGVKLEPINDISRCRYGSNNYNESAIKQFLNSKEDVFNWQPKTTYDRLSTGVPYSGAGFLKLLDPELVKVIGAVDKEVARNTITDGGGQDLFSDKVFLLSPKEVYAFNEGTIIGEEPYQYYSMMSETITNATVDWRIKYLGSSPRNWWLRSPNVGYSHFARYVTTSGFVSYYYARNAFGVSPACVIY